MDISDKVAMVTGASRGIGRQMALDLARAGAHVAVAARSGALLEELAGEIREFGREALVFTGDMAQENDIKAFVGETVDDFGRIDILVNNAGLGVFYPVAEMPTAEWDEMFNLNVRGLFICTREALPHLRKSGEGVVVNVASLAGKNAFVNGGGYAASKHAVMGFSRCLMLEERKNGIRVLAICPGSVETNFTEAQRGHRMKLSDNALHPGDVSDAVLHMIRMPQRSLVSEIDIRPSNP